AHVESDDLTGRGVHRNPDRVPVCLLAYKAPELIQLGLQPLQDHRRSTVCWLYIQMLRSRLESHDHKLQEPLQPNAHCAADPTQRDSLQQQSFNQRALFFGDDRIRWRQHKGPATEFATVILFARMNVAVSLEPHRPAPWTCLSGYHDALMPPRFHFLL